MINITFGAQGLDPIEEIKREIKTFDEDARRKTDELGDETAQRMKDLIQGSKVRPQADEPLDLENNINTDHFEYGWGVGDIAELKKNAPGWAALNWGSKHMVGQRLPAGTYQPGVSNPTSENFRGGRWKKGMYGTLGGKLYHPIVTKPILPINYLERTIVWLENKINEIFGA